MKNSTTQSYKDADQLLAKAFEYFAWCDENPWLKKELMRSGELKGETINIPLKRPYTLAGLCIYCGITEITFMNYLKDEYMQDAASFILDSIRQNLMEGALLGEYNASFTAHLIENL